jgi:serine/threonine-protein kinase
VQPLSSANGGGLDEPATVDLSGRCVGNSYILICPVGQGATGTVWRGIERASGEQVAVKLLHEGLLRQPKLVTRFVQERTILMMVRHENIVGVRDLFSAGESLGLVMDFVAGGSLRERLRAHGTLAPAEAARLLAQVASALAEAHGLGVVHRDVKPDNILLQAGDGRLDVRLTDFGIARVIDAAGLTTPHSIIGTPHYMAPEVISGGEASPAADVYALGVVLYELVAGRTPYAGEPIAVLRRHLDDEPDRPAGMPDPTWSVIESCLDKDPARRPAAGDLGPVLRDLARGMADQPALPAPLEDPTSLGPPAPVTHPSAPQRPRPPRKRPRNGPRSWVWGRPGVIVALIAGCLLASGIGGYNVWNGRDTGSTHTTATPAQGIAAGGTGHLTRSTAGASQVPAVPTAAVGGLPTAASGRREPSVGAQARVSAGAGGIGLSAGPGRGGGEVVFGPWQCGDEYSWNVGHPVLAKPCHAIGDAIRVVGHIEATPGVQADVSVSVRDAKTDQVAAGPYTCAGLMFTDFALEHTCGPVDLRVPRGGRYVVVESWQYTGRSLLPGGTARGPEFAW